MTVSELIKELKGVVKADKVGDREILIASDEEGNSFGELSPKTMFGEDENKKYLILYPHNTIEM